MCNGPFVEEEYDDRYDDMDEAEQTAELLADNLYSKIQSGEVTESTARRKYNHALKGV